MACRQRARPEGARDEPRDFLFEDFNDELVIALRAWMSENRSALSDGQRAISASSASDLRKLAVENLERHPAEGARCSQDDRLAMLTAGGDYEASLLLFDASGADGQVKVNGDIVVAVPAKDVLLVTGSKNRKGRRALREVAAKLKAESRYRLTDTLFVYRDGRFARFGGK